MTHPYVGRFAPTPSGPMHLGSLVAALGSWLDARHYQGKWHVRMENLDTPRNQTGADTRILRSLEAHGLTWDDAVVRQSERLDLYQSALTDLTHQEWVFPCACSRKEIEEQGGLYPGTCREGISEGKTGRATRIRCPQKNIQFNDRGFGDQSEQLDQTTGDFILKRADGVFSYQFAVVVDDIQQGITQIVRGADLLSSTARQIFLYSAFNKTTPHYLHLPLVINADGQKLSKQNRAPALNDLTPIENVYAALRVLQPALNLPIETAPKDTLHNLLAWAISHWAISLQPAPQGIWGADQMELRHDPHQASI